MARAHAFALWQPVHALNATGRSSAHSQNLTPNGLAHSRHSGIPCWIEHRISEIPNRVRSRRRATLSLSLQQNCVDFRGSVHALCPACAVALGFGGTIWCGGWVIRPGRSAPACCGRPAPGRQTDARDIPGHPAPGTAAAVPPWVPLSRCRCQSVRCGKLARRQAHHDTRNTW